MSVASDFSAITPVEVLRPAQQRVPFVFSSPHSGSYYPERFLMQSRLNRSTIRRSEDFAVNALFGAVIDRGAPMIAANFPRAYLDVNREPMELDPRMFRERLPAQANTRSPRVVGGLGTVPRVVAEGMDIYHGLLPLEEAIDRIRNLYEPYHRQLQRLLAETCALFGHAVLVDCHSMPGLVRGPNGSQADVIIGDRYGSSSRPIVSRHALDGLRHAGFTVAHNRPYAGGYITEHYGRPASGIHAIQIEISRGLYMDERLMVPSKTFVETRERINLFLDQLMMLSSWDLSPFPMSPPIAAE